MMKNVPPMIVALVVGLAIPLFAQLSRDAAIAKAEAVLKNLQDGKTADIVKDFDARLTQDLPETKLKAAWPGLVAQFGAFKSIADRREGQMKDRQAVELILAFEKETIVQRAVFDNEGKVAGLVFRPLSSAVLPASK
jgi:Protein of unknown function (DUF3887)